MIPDDRGFQAGTVRWEALLWHLKLQDPDLPTELFIEFCHWHRSPANQAALERVEEDLEFFRADGNEGEKRATRR